MITYNANFDKPYWENTQKIYDIYIADLNFSSLVCADIECRVKGHCKIHAYYKRWLILPEEKIILLILRVICGKCNKTHAILPSFIVPYSQVPLEEHVEIIKLHEEEKSASKIAKERNNTEIDAAKILYIIQQYKIQWKERLNSIFCTVTDEISKLVKSCFAGYKQQFMQNRCTPNILYFLKN